MHTYTKQFQMHISTDDKDAVNLSSQHEIVNEQTRANSKLQLHCKHDDIWLFNRVLLLITFIVSNHHEHISPSDFTLQTKLWIVTPLSQP